MKLIAIAFALALTACNGVNEQAAFKPVAYTCAAAAFMLETATDVRAKMSAMTQAIVTRAAGIINPICSSPTPPTLTSTAQLALGAALAELTAAVQGAQQL